MLAVAALFLMSMPFVLVRFAGQPTEELQREELPSEKQGGVCELAPEAKTELHSAPSSGGGTGRAGGSTPGRLAADCDLYPAGMSLVLQPIHAIE
jgi:hypothetical protein